MNTLSLHNLLISLGVQGLLWTLLLLALCFGGVYVASLARLGWEYKTERENAALEEGAKKEKSAPAEKPQEPIYYIVEKKKRRPKNGYGTPKPIQFKER